MLAGIVGVAISHNQRQCKILGNIVHVPAGEAAFNEAERLLTVAQAPAVTVGLAVTEEVGAAIQLQALEIRP
jgi:hypothetical protein